jgi:DNA replication and repair protein RecF
MIIDSIVIRNVRNLRDVHMRPPAKFNVFVGDNGQGKTNLLETIYLVSSLRSFRATRLNEMVQVGAATAEVQAIVEYQGLKRHYHVQLEEGRRKAFIDGKSVRPVTKYFGDFNVVVFTPDDLHIPRGSPGERRRFIDRAVFNRDASYLATVTDYDKVLRSRNHVLKELAGKVRSTNNQSSLLSMLDVFDEQLIKIGSKIINDRKSYLVELLPIVRSCFEAITRNGLAVECNYQSDIASNEPLQTTEMFRAQLRDTRGKDMARQSTSVGPHRDDVAFELNGHKASEYASQGQLRAIVLAWKAAEIELITRTRQQTPILLLDDVSSELDATRNAYLFEYLCNTAGQCFITTTDDKHVLLHENRANFRVESGEIKLIHSNV